MKRLSLFDQIRLILKNVSPVNMSEDGSINKVCKLLGVDDGDDGKPIGEGYYQSVFLCTEGGRYS